MIYLASPYSSKSFFKRTKRFIQVAKATGFLVKNDIFVFSPILYGVAVEFFSKKKTWKFWMDFCLIQLQGCDELWILEIDGWKESEGIQEEIKEAYSIGMPIKIFNPLTKKTRPFVPEIGTNYPPNICRYCGAVCSNISIPLTEKEWKAEAIEHYPGCTWVSSKAFCIEN
jgi:hypothetical protein